MSGYDPNTESPIPLNAIQSTYLHGRSKSFALGGRAAFVYLELAFAERLDPRRLASAWRILLRSNPHLLRRPVQTGREGDGFFLVHDGSLLSSPALLDLSSAVEGDDALPEIRRKIRGNRLALEEFRPVDGTLVLGRDWSRLCLRMDLITFGSAGINAFLENLAELLKAEDPGEARTKCIDSRPREASSRQENIPSERIATLAGPEFPLSASRDLGAWTSGMELISAEETAALEKLATHCGLSLEELLAFAFCEIASHWSTAKEFAYPVLLPPCSLTVLPYAATEGKGPTLKDRWRAAKKEWDRLKAYPGHAVLREIARKTGGTDGSPIPFALSLNLGAGHDFWTAAAKLGATVEVLAVETPFVLHDVQIFSKEGGLAVHHDAYRNAFEPGVAGPWMTHFVRFLRNLAEAPTRVEEPGYDPIPFEQARARKAVNDNRQVIGQDELLHTGFYRHADLYPERIALISEERVLTYGELRGRASSVAQRLRALDTTPGELVAVLMHKGWEQAVAVLGVLEAGGAYLPLSPSLPEDRLSYLLDVCGVRTILTQSGLGEGSFESRGRHLIPVDQLPLEDVPPEPSRAKQSDLAYVIFTSGSTGTPKGVMIDHKGAVNTLIDINERFGITCADRSLAISNLNFDLSVFDLFGLFRAGGSVIMPNESGNGDPRHWLHMARTHKATVWNSVPAIFSLALSRMERLGDPMPESLRLAMLSGDWIPLDLPERAWRFAPNLRLVGLGGATEASIWSNFHEITHLSPTWKSIPYGRPLKNQWFAVRDSQGRDCPDGVPGELVIGGSGVAMGYWQDPERTGAAFLTDPATGQRIYRTGDLGRYLEGGILEFLGRKDSQVKVNGYRVELGEIEAVLTEADGVAEAVVACQGERFGTKTLVAFVVPDDSDGLADRLTETLRAHLQGKLPPYMVPSVIEIIDRLPLTANGKVDRKNLPEVTGSSPNLELCLGDPVAEDLARIYAKVLPVSDVMIDRSFFDLGGDSLGAIEVLSHIELAFGVAISMAGFVRESSICSVARKLTRAKTENDASEAMPLSPLSPSPSRVVAVDRLDRNEGKDGDGRPTLVLIHPVGGQVACYRHLTQALGEGFRIFGISALAGDQSVRWSLEDLAEECRRSLEAKGIVPDMLVGWSFGGFLSYVLEKTLRTARPPLLIDSLPSILPEDQWTEDRLRESFQSDLSENGRLPVSHISDQVLSRSFEVYKRNMLALARFNPEQAGPKVMLAAAEGHAKAVAAYWGALGPHEPLVSLVGDHFDAVKEANARRLARMIQRLFDQEVELRYGNL